MGTLGDSEVISPQEALTRGYGAVVDAQIRRVADLELAVRILQRRANHATDPALRILCARQAREHLNEIRGIVALDAHEIFKVTNLDRLDGELAAQIINAAAGPLMMGA